MWPSDERVKELTDRLEKGITDLFDSSKYTEYLKAMSKFHSYSYGNVMLILFQCPEASRVAGFVAWKQKFHRHVKAEEKGLQILAPVTYKKWEKQVARDPATRQPLYNADGTVKTEDVLIKRTKFKVAYVFDISQTEGQELPTLGVDELTGNVQSYNVFFKAICDISPVPLMFRDKPERSKGAFYHKDQCIRINPGMSEVQTLKTAIHEVTHAKLHNDIKKPGKTEPRKDKQTREVEAESTAYVVCQHFGIDTSDYSFGYVAGWSSGRELDELKSSLTTISDTAKEIIDGIESRCPELFPFAEKSEEKEYRPKKKSRHPKRTRAYSSPTL